MNKTFRAMSPVSNIVKMTKQFKQYNNFSTGFDES